jgi:ABC-2 type transport system ATP-binding protein
VIGLSGQTPAINLHALTRDYGPVRAVSELSFEVPRGIIFGFLGPNGAGKTTTINLLLGLLEPTTGRAEVLGHEPWRDGEEVRRQTGAVLENSGVYEQLSAEEILEFFGRVWKIPAAARQGRMRELLEPAGLWERRREKAGAWSRGMQQRLALARALLHRPAVLFLDEPTAGLDVMAANAVRDELAELPIREGTTVFLTTHNMAEAERLCALVAVIRSGQLIALGSPAELRAGTGAPHVEFTGNGFDDRMVAALRALPQVAEVVHADGRLDVRLAHPAEPAPLVNLLVTMGAQISEVRRGQPSLEDVFVTLMKEEQ